MGFEVLGRFKLDGCNSVLSCWDYSADNSSVKQNLKKTRLILISENPTDRERK